MARLPIVELASDLILHAETHRIALSGEGVDRLSAELATLESSTKLKESLEALLAFAYFVDTELQSPEVAKGLLGVVRGALPALEQQGKAATTLRERTESLETNRSAYAQLKGGSAHEEPVARTGSLGWDDAEDG